MDTRLPVRRSALTFFVLYLQAPLQDTLPQAYVLSRQLKTDSFIPSVLDLLLNKKF
jgi:hypothetical protein